MNLLSRISYIFFLLTICAAPGLAQQQDVNTRQFKLARIQFEGLTNQSAQKAAELSGLQIEQPVTMTNLNEAAQRLLASGIFSAVKFRYKYQGDNLTAIFVVEEARGSMLCVFDNFFWFSDEEILSAIRQDIPNFDGKAPDGGDMIATIRRALEKLLRTKNIAGTIEYEMAGGGSAHVFKAAGVPSAICSIQYQGVAAISEKQLTEAAKELIGSDYSRLINRIVIRETIVPLYRQRGHLKIKTLPLQAAPEKSPAEKCKGGASLLLTVEEGVAYKWKGIVWSGNQAITADKLDAPFGLQADVIADGIKIDKGFALAERAYNDKGYMTAQIKPQAEFDETQQTVSFKAVVTEGEQYTFGQLTVKGLSENVIKNFLERWQQMSGKPYDTEQLNKFTKRLLSENTAQIRLTLQAEVQRQINHDRRNVDLTLDFK